MGGFEKGTVYILGAGASHGESLAPIEVAESQEPTNPPLATGFFSESLLSRLGSVGIFEERLKQVIAYVKLHWGIKESLGLGMWNELSLEQVLSNVENDLEFIAHESRNWIHRLEIKIELIGHIHAVIGASTHHKYGELSRRLAQSLSTEDSILCFNWDLLLDQELLSKERPQQYEGFLKCLEIGSPGKPPAKYLWRNGLFLKPHGSLNWFRCSNPSCPTHRSFVVKRKIQTCLEWAKNPQYKLCANCGEKMFALIVPPIAHKRITQDNVIRHIWGLARTKLRFAKKLVLIGYSLPRSDFYSEWLLRSSTTHLSRDTILVVNPSNDPDAAEHSNFASRMRELFPRGFNSDLRTFAEIDKIIAWASA